MYACMLSYDRVSTLFFSAAGIGEGLLPISIVQKSWQTWEDLVAVVHC